MNNTEPAVPMVISIIFVGMIVMFQQIFAGIFPTLLTVFQWGMAIMTALLTTAGLLILAEKIENKIGGAKN